MKDLGCQTKGIEVNLTNRLQNMDERISAVEYEVEETDNSVKENVKSKKKIPIQNMLEMWGTMKRPGKEEGKNKLEEQKILVTQSLKKISPV